MARGEWRAAAVELLEATVHGLGGERRDGQVALTEAVADAIDTGHHLVAEAPTGSGKSLAYLAPAVASGRRVVVATSTRALQAQLVGSDIPALQEHGGVDFGVALLKGRSNYVCLAKLRAAARPDALFDEPVGTAFGVHLTRVQEFAAASETGDRSEMPDAVPDASWAAVSATSMECPGRLQCADGEACFAERARERARDADIVVVNHALYGTHLAAGGAVLPDHDVVVLDEAHAFAESTTNQLGADLVPDALGRLGPGLARAGASTERIDALTRAVNALDAAVGAREGRVDLGADTEIATLLLAVAEALATANADATELETDDAKRAKRLADARLEVVRRLAEPGPDDVMWIERTGRTRRLRMAPVVVGGAIAALLLQQRPVIAVSATLGGRAPFADFATDAGFSTSDAPGHWGGTDDDGNRVSATGRGYVGLQVPSSFDWRAQGVLYVGKDLPDPTRANDAWLAAAGSRLVQLVQAAGGRALVLCTSRANVDRFATRLRDETDHDVLAQGDADAGRLGQMFAEREASVLVGTRSFWQGIDTPGTACILVVIDRIPFPSPGEPLHAARRERAERQGHNAFFTVDIPVAARVLAQGVGRLIRRRDDRGVVAVLDHRLASSRYRAQLLDAVPPLRRSIDLADACAFLAEASRGLS